jgi:hypothetical protein
LRRDLSGARALERENPMARNLLFGGAPVAGTYADGSLIPQAPPPPGPGALPGGGAGGADGGDGAVAARGPAAGRRIRVP